MEPNRSPESLPQNLVPPDFSAFIRSKREAAKSLSPNLDERGELIRRACQAAAEIEASRIRSGLPPSQPAPWPSSTWEFLRKHAANAQHKKEST